MATDVRKFLDSAGVGILWNAITAELNKKAIADNVYTKKEVDDKIAAVPTYDDTELKADVKANTDAIAVLNGEAGEEGSVAYKITKMVLEADENNATDKIAEIAAWIANHPTDAAEYNQRIATNAADIEALEKLVGNTAVATQIANAIAAENLDQYALASELTSLANRVTVVEGKVAVNEGAIAGHESRLTAVEGKASGNEAAIGNLSGRLDNIVAQGGEPNAINNIKVNGIIQAIAADKSVDLAVPVLDALSEADIKAACGLE